MISHRKYTIILWITQQNQHQYCRFLLSLHHRAESRVPKGVRLLWFFIRIDMERAPSYCLSRYLQVALTMIEKPKRNIAPTMQTRPSCQELSFAKKSDMPTKRHIQPIMPIAAETKSLLLRIGFSSILNKFLHKVTNSCGVTRLCA